MNEKWGKSMSIEYLWISIYFSHLAAQYWLGNIQVIPSNRKWLSVVWLVSLSAALAYLFTGAWANIWIPLAVGLITLLQITVFQRKLKKEPAWNLLYELIWFICAFILSKIIPFDSLFWLSHFGEGYYGILILLAGWTVSAFPVGTGIGLLLKKFSDKTTVGFPDAGKMIGILERSILFLLFLINAPVGVGFLITAKTLFRFGEISKGGDQKAVEYILIGTLLSFLFGMMITIGTIWIADIFFTATQFKLFGY